MSIEPYPGFSGHTANTRRSVAQRVAVADFDRSLSDFDKDMSDFDKVLSARGHRLEEVPGCTVRRPAPIPNTKANRCSLGPYFQLVTVSPEWLLGGPSRCYQRDPIKFRGSCTENSTGGG